VISLYNTNPNIKNFDLTGIAIAKRDLGIAFRRWILMRFAPQRKLTLYKKALDRTILWYFGFGFDFGGDRER